MKFVQYAKCVRKRSKERTRKEGEDFVNFQSKFKSFSTGANIATFSILTVLGAADDFCLSQGLSLYFIILLPKIIMIIVDRGLLY